MRPCQIIAVEQFIRSKIRSGVGVGRAKVFPSCRLGDTRREAESPEWRGEEGRESGNARKEEGNHWIVHAEWELSPISL